MSKIIIPEQTIALPSQFAGYYKLEGVKIGPDGKERRRTIADWFPNLITDFGLNGWGTLSLAQMTTNCRVGAGTATPAFGNTTLGAQIGATTVVSSGFAATSQATPPYYYSQTATWRFNPGVAAGNLSEVGNGRTATGADLFSRALILDGAGNPTTITILADEYLDVTYQVRDYMPTADVPYSIVISGVTYSGIMRRANVDTVMFSTSNVAGCDNGVNAVTAYNGAIGAVTSAPAGTNTAISVNNLGYANNSYQMDFGGTAALTQMNLAGGITAIMVRTSFGYFQFSISPAIPKDANKTLALVFRCGPWARYP